MACHPALHRTSSDVGYDSATLASRFGGPPMHPHCPPHAAAASIFSTTAASQLPQYPRNPPGAVDLASPSAAAHHFPTPSGFAFPPMASVVLPPKPRRYYKHDPFHRTKREARDIGVPVGAMARVTKYRLWYVLEHASAKAPVLVAIGVESRDSHYDYFSLPGIEPPLAGVQNTTAVAEWLIKALGCECEVKNKAKAKLKAQIPEWTEASINELLDRAGAPIRNGKRAPPGTAVQPKLKRRADEPDPDEPPGPPTVEDAELLEGWTDFQYQKTANTDKGRGTCQFWLVQAGTEPLRRLLVVTGVEPRAGAKSYVYSIGPGLGEGTFKKRSMAEAWIKLHFLHMDEAAAAPPPAEPPAPKVLCSALEQCFGGDGPLAKWATQAASEECRAHARAVVELVRRLICAAGTTCAAPCVDDDAGPSAGDAIDAPQGAAGGASELLLLTSLERDGEGREAKLWSHVSQLAAEEATLPLLQETDLHRHIAWLRSCGHEQLSARAALLCKRWAALAEDVESVRRAMRDTGPPTPAAADAPRRT